MVQKIASDISYSYAYHLNMVDKLIPALHEHGGRFIQLSCSLPYDAGRYPYADAVLLAWSPKGMSENPNYRGDGDLAQYGPAMPAAVYMAFSDDETTTGKLPVNIPAIDMNYKYTDDIIYERGYGLEYSGAVLMCCCVYYNAEKVLIDVKRIDSDNAESEVEANKPDDAAFAKIFRWRTDMTMMADVLFVGLINSF